MAEYYCLDGKFGDVKSVEFDDSICVNDDGNDCNGYFSLRDNYFEFTVNCNDVCDDTLRLMKGKGE